MASSTRVSMTGFRAAAVPTVTSPAPTRSAAVAVMAAAPVLPGEPPTTRRCPVRPLWASAGRLGSMRRTSSGVSRRCRGATASATASGMPMSTTSTVPASSAPG